jgi:hypothetical protein
MKKIYQAPVAACCPMTAQGYLLAGSNRIKGAVVKDMSTQTESEINVGQDEENITGLSKKSFDPWSSWDE